MRNIEMFWYNILVIRKRDKERREMGLSPDKERDSQGSLI